MAELSRMNPLKIADLTIDPPLVLGPMAGMNSMPLRLLCRRAGAGLVCSEMVSANALHYGSKKTDELLASTPREQPLSIQVFGSDPARVARAGQVAEDAGASVVDINMGCPVRKVIKSGAGSALMREPALAAEIVAATVEAVDVPVTAKIRAGNCEGDDSYLDLAKGLAAAGAAAVAIHGRTVGQGYKGKASWEAIARLVEAVPVPVIGNGDVFAGQDAVRMMYETGCAGVMVARGALGNPFVFLEAKRLLRGEPAGETPLRWKLAAALWHAQANALHHGETSGVRRLRAQACWYSKGIPGSADFRRQACIATTLAELAQAILTLVENIKPGTRTAGDNQETMPVDE